MLKQSDYDDLRTLQTELTVIDAKEKQRLAALDEARGKAGNMENSLRGALADPRSRWETVQQLDKDLALVRLEIASLEDAVDGEAAERGEQLRRDVQAKVGSMLGVAAEPEADAPAEPALVETP